ncbi:hypothetical protein [Chryseobacterium oryctis]|uniref:Outer membrane protein beta-barrel domain-containing protein n=1 Tax=Chryseobacterium oryctis TaxID=2952618 RepID=A0ABT3HIW0_9FLAO|nr:hypothetical protein [Chryseobacterium oryctis]MCW3159721.1 hypothetical protein [Chryseobacterium oryctis]
MLLRRIIFFFSVILLNFSFAQKRKKLDTVYVYEKVTIYDTIYLEKPLKLKSNNYIFSPSKIIAKEIKDIYKENIEKKEIEELVRKKINNRFQYGIEAGFGFKNTNWGGELFRKKQQFGEHIGAWISKSLSFTPNLSLQFSADVYRWSSTFDLDGTKEDTFLNGFYFTEDNQPLLFQRFNNKHFEYALQLKLLYEWKNIRPFTGVLANHSAYKMQFLVPEDNVLDKLDDFKNKEINIGFSLGVQYIFLKRFIVSIEYQQYKMKNISLKNSNFDFDIFKTNNNFAERKINFGISYIISK